ncbi:MAG TPA: carboxypeptidase regulatory-like domain-containing protein [Thermoanaerobaculia bacterium]
MKSSRYFAVVALLLVASLSALGQGTTSTLSGTVTHEGAGLPGVTVTISSPNLQGVRTTVTNEAGGYTFPSIPPGQYSVRFEMEGMSAIEQSVRVSLASTARADADLKLSAVTEAITVTASAPAVLETQEVQSNITAEAVEELPIPRTLQATTLLSPGVTVNTNTNGIQISGAYSYDNLFLVNGAVTNENLRGQTHNLFIEDAIQETTVMTGAISAEFGRFTGGVVSAITKSGGNEFHGSLRDSLTNSSWTEVSDFGEADPIDKINSVYEGTLGGRILRDRLWFFAAGRLSELSTSQTFTRSTTNFTFGDEETRLEGKLTGQITPKHSLIASYFDIKRDQSSYCFVSCFEQTNIDVARSLPNNFLTAQYSGVLTNNWLVDATYSKKYYAFEGSGGDLRATLGNAPIADVARATAGYDGAVAGAFFGAPVFCGVCDPEERNNHAYGLKSTYFLGTKSLGSHSIVGGYENWSEQRIANNFQSGSDFFVNLYNFSPTVGMVNGTTRPVIEAGDAIAWWPILEFTQGSDWQTNSLYVNDKWDLNPHFSFNLGLRYDANEGRDSSGNLIADDAEFSPRLGAIYDVRGDGRVRLNASYSRYVSRIAETIGGSAGRGGNPAAFYWEYDGPTINADRSLDYVGAFTQLLQWFQANGEVTIPTAYGNVSVPGVDRLFFIDVPGLTSQFNGTLKSPSVDELTLGAGFQIGPNGFLRADVIHRDWKNMYARRIDQSTGSVLYEPFGLDFDLGIVENTNDLERTYNALQLQGNYRLSQRFTIGGNYTYSRTEGNTSGETSSNGPIPDATFQYGEYKHFAQFNPSGLLAGIDQTHKARVWASIDLPTPVGNFNFSVLERFDSGTPYGAIGTIDLRERTSFYADGTPGGVANPGYVTAPNQVNYYFTDRDAFRWDDEIATDIGINYELPIRNLGIFVQADIVNVFNQQAVINGDTTVYTHRNDPDGVLGRFNPIAGDVPVQGVHYEFGEDFGKAVSSLSYQLPRTYRFSLGLRF